MPPAQSAYNESITWTHIAPIVAVFALLVLWAVVAARR